MYQKKTLLFTLMLILFLETATAAPSVQNQFSLNSPETPYAQPIKGSTPGEIADISFSNLHPNLGEPIQIQLTLKGNRWGRPFSQLLEITDTYHGLTASPQGLIQISGEFIVTSGLITIGRLPHQKITIEYYPSIIGNHSLKFRAGIHPEKIHYITVGFTSDGIMYPSLGCPQMISRDEGEELTVLISEQQIKNTNTDIITIQEIQLQEINSHAAYSLQNHTEICRLWIHRNNNQIEEECMIRCSVSSIPNGFYNLYVRTNQNEYCWKHAVKIQDAEPEKYSVVQLTDIHIGKSANTVFETIRCRRIIKYITTQIRPDFILITGDSVDWANTKKQHNFFQILRNLLYLSNVPVYTLPGNHERYENRMLRLYHPFMNISAYNTYLNPFNDYAFEYGDINYIMLDSGYELSRYDRGITPESSGLTNTQMHLIQTYLGDSTCHQIIAMHHPAVNNRNDKGLQSIPNPLPSGNNECITKNRKEFIKYCIQNNVAIVLSGHSHKNKVLDYRGNKPDTAYDQTLFVQTDSATLASWKGLWRTVIVSNGTINSYELSSI